MALMTVDFIIGVSVFNIVVRVAQQEALYRIVHQMTLFQRRRHAEASSPSPANKEPIRLVPSPVSRTETEAIQCHQHSTKSKTKVEAKSGS